MRWTKAFRIWALAVALLTMAAGAGCGSQAPQSAPQPAPSTPAPTSGVDKAKELVAKAEQPVQWKDPGPAFKVKGDLKGKTVYFVANGLNYPFVQNDLKGLKESASLFGMEVVAVDGAGQVAKAANLIQEGIARKASAIVIEAFPAEQLSAPLAAAKKAGIPVIEQFGRDPTLPPSTLGVSAVVSYCYSCAGRQMADLAVAQSGGKVNAVVFDVPEIGVSELEKDGFLNELHDICPSCKATVVEAPLAQWSTTLASLTASVIQRDPTVNYLVPLYDSMIALMKPAVVAAGAQNRIKFISYNATLPAMQDLQKGQFVAGDVGSPQHWAGWATTDQILRLLSGLPPVADENIPNRTFTASNIRSINLNDDEATWYGSVNFAAQYKKLWGVG